MIKSIKIKLHPNHKQQTQMFRTLNCSRYAYNWAIATQMQNFKDGNKFIGEFELRRMFTEHKKENEWLYAVSNDALKQSIKDACTAYKNFFDKQKKKGYEKYTDRQKQHAKETGKLLTVYNMQGHPKFKKKQENKVKYYMDTDKIEVTSSHVKPEKIADSKRRNRLKANFVKLAESDRIPVNTKYINPRIGFDGISFWLSLVIETESKIEPPATEEGIGIDIGVKELAICSNGSVYKNINKTKIIKKLKKKQRRLQRRVSRKYLKNKKGESYCKTSNIIKSEKQLLKINQRLTNIRHNHLHQTTSEIVKTKPSYIVVEDLNVKGMMSNRHLAKVIQEQCFYEFYRQMEYKTKWNNIKFIEAPRFYPSSKTCSQCGKIKLDLKLKDRIYKCDCGLEIDRDLNASINLCSYGLAI